MTLFLPAFYPVTDNHAAGCDVDVVVEHGAGQMVIVIVDSVLEGLKEGENQTFGI